MFSSIFLGKPILCVTDTHPEGSCRLEVIHFAQLVPVKSLISHYLLLLTDCNFVLGIEIPFLEVLVNLSFYVLLGVNLSADILALLIELVNVVLLLDCVLLLGRLHAHIVLLQIPQAVFQACDRETVGLAQFIANKVSHNQVKFAGDFLA